MNPNAAAAGKPAASIVMECAANWEAVLFNAFTACPATSTPYSFPTSTGLGPVGPLKPYRHRHYNLYCNSQFREFSSYINPI